jgi:hypothetical protein
MDWPYNVLLSLSWQGIDFSDIRCLPWYILLGEPRHLPFCQLFDPICLLMLAVSNRDNKVQYPSVVIDDIPLRVFAGGEGNHAAIDVQSSLEVGYFVSKSKGGQCALLLPSLNSGGEALGNVKDGGRVVLVELHHRFGRARGDGLCRSHGGLYGG